MKNKFMKKLKNQN